MQNKTSHAVDASVCLVFYFPALAKARTYNALLDDCTSLVGDALDRDMEVSVTVISDGMGDALADDLGQRFPQLAITRKAR